MKQLSELLADPSSSSDDQKLVQYYLNYYQNRKEAIPLIANLASSNNIALIQLFLNQDYGSVNVAILF